MRRSLLTGVMAILLIMGIGIDTRHVHANAKIGGRAMDDSRHISCGNPFGIQDLVETRLGDYTDVVDAGTGIVRLEGQNGLNWALVEQIPGAYDWTRTDALARELSQEGLEVIWTVSSHHPDSGQIHFLPADMEGYLAFLSSAVERYDGDGFQDAPDSPVVRHFQIENEVDGHFWEDTAANYAFLLQESIRVIKTANPSAEVAIAGASTPEGYNRFYPSVLAEFAPDDEWFDICDVHWYESVGDYAIHPRGDISLVTFLQDLRQTLGDIEIWFTEVGTHSGSDVDPGKPAQTETQQAAELVKRYAHYVGNGVSRVFWHTMLESRAYTKSMHQNDFFDNTGLIYNGFTYLDGTPSYQPTGVGEDRGDGVRKLAYYSYRLLAEKLSDYEWVEAIQQTDQGYVYMFRVAETNRWIVWREGGGSVTLTVPDASRIRVTSTVPQAVSGSQLSNEGYPAFFETAVMEVEQESVTLLLTELPVLVEPERP